MARWKLMEPHYLKVPENYWEQTETDQATGKQKRKKYPVPTHLDPKDPGVWTHKSGDRDITQGGTAFTDGEILVSWEKGYVYERPDGVVFVCSTAVADQRDLIFEGPPTPGMQPIDEEAKAITAQFEWTKPSFGDSEMTYAERLIMDKAASDKSVQEQTLAALGAMAKSLEAVLGRLMGPERRV